MKFLTHVPMALIPSLHMAVVGVTFTYTFVCSSHPPPWNSLMTPRVLFKGESQTP